MESVQLLDLQGRLLAATALAPEGDGLAALDARPSHELLHYYFARSGRRVLIEAGGGSRAGLIVGTRWTPSSRVWLLEPELLPAA